MLSNDVLNLVLSPRRVTLEIVIAKTYQILLKTVAAANILNVSRPHMVKLLEDGCLPFHKTGRHRRIRFADLMEYKKQRNAESMEAMKALANQAQELGIY
ncbi:DNA-binding protein, excisionase family [Photorhabdus aegyptia]|uniref:DNA-binding protein, excisionase family n=1 Tax=Photorhabdus aegyptia TaxID=2805098 RepID=A0A022PHL2_9GAMM|nr:DNA-binding protein, excisionase family [Photorhabdus aegyptia]